MRYFTISIKVAYDETTVPKKKGAMEQNLREGVFAAIEYGLLNDADKRVIIEEYSVDVKETMQ